LTSEFKKPALNLKLTPSANFLMMTDSTFPWVSTLPVMMSFGWTTWLTGPWRYWMPSWKSPLESEGGMPNGDAFLGSVGLGRFMVPVRCRLLERLPPSSNRKPYKVLEGINYEWYKRNIGKYVVRLGGRLFARESVWSSLIRRIEECGF